MSRCSSTSEDAVAYRRRVVRRAESTWAALFSQAIRRVSWDSIRANPGAAIATTAVAVWVVAAVSVTLLTFAGSHAAHAQGPANWLPRRTCPGSPDKRRDLLEESCGRPGHGDRPHIRRREAVPDRHSALSLRVVPGPTVAVARGVELALAFALAQALEIALALAIALAFALALASPSPSPSSSPSPTA